MLHILGVVFLFQATAQPPTARVTVSRRELRVEFSESASRRWAWPAMPVLANIDHYAWEIALPTTEGEKYYGLTVQQPARSPAEPRSLSELVSLGKVLLWQPGVIVIRTRESYGDATVETHGDDARLVITWRDSASIASLFASHPAYIGFRRLVPGPASKVARDSARVEYADPRLHVPTKAERDAWELERQRNTTVFLKRTIAGVDPRDTTLYLNVGDTAALRVVEAQCRRDSCIDGYRVYGDRWSMADSSVATVDHPKHEDSLGTTYEFNGVMIARGLRPGVTRLRVDGVQSFGHMGEENVGSNHLEARVVVRQPGTRRVTVSRHEARVEFTEAAPARWDWTDAPDSTYYAGYSWRIGLETADGPRWPGIEVRRGYEGKAREFPSLDSVVTSSVLEVCQPNMIRDCTRVQGDASGSVANGEAHITFTIRNDSVIAALFGDRPARIGISWQRPGPYLSSGDSVQVDYVEPQIPIMTAAQRAAWRTARARYERGSVSYNLGGGEIDHSVWLAVGEKARLYVAEMTCHIDVCSSNSFDSLVGKWTIADSSIARLGQSRQSLMVGKRMMIYGDNRMEVTGRRVGATTLSAPAPDSTIVRSRVHVTRPLRRLRLEPRIATMRAGQPVTFVPRLTDIAGNRITGFPFSLSRMRDTTPMWGWSSTKPVPVQFDTAGTYRLIAKFKRLADTLTITVTPR